MFKIKVSIIMLFCDKDVCYLERQLKRIKKYVKQEHEVLLLDNRVEDKTDISNLEKYYDKLFCYNMNCYNYGRLRLVNEAQGEYIWFVDVDDLVFELPEEINDIHLTDVIVFDYRFETDSNKQPDRKGDLNFALWNKLYRTKICKKMASLLDGTKQISIFDDNIMQRYLKNNCNGFKKINKSIYTYNSKQSRNFGLHDFSDKILEELFIGLPYYEEELKSIGLENDIFDVVGQMCSFLFLKVKNKDLRIKYYKKIYNQFPKLKKDIINFLIKKENVNMEMAEKIFTE